MFDDLGLLLMSMLLFDVVVIGVVVGIGVVSVCDNGDVVVIDVVVFDFL